MNQLTIRGFDPQLERKIRELARAEGISLNKAVIRLLRKGAGLGEERTAQHMVGDSIDHLIGTWTIEEAADFEDAIRDLSEVDDSLWS